jgi:hypothetical protein
MRQAIAIHPQLLGYLPAVSSPTLVSLCISTVGLGLVATPPAVPGHWRVGGLILLGIGAICLLMALVGHFRTRARLVRATRLLKSGTPMTMRVVFSRPSRGVAFADLAPVKKGAVQSIAKWPLAPVGAHPNPHADKPVHRIPVFVPPTGVAPDVGTSVQAEVMVDPTDDSLIVITLRNGCLLSRGR